MGWSDTRLAAAKMSKEEFMTGIQGPFPDTDDDIDSLVHEYNAEFQKVCQGFPSRSLLQDKTRYRLRYRSPVARREVYAVEVGEDGRETVVGVFDHETVLVHTKHRGNGLGQELVLAAFEQKPWGKEDLIQATSRGLKLFGHAHAYARQCLL